MKKRSLWHFLFFGLLLALGLLIVFGLPAVGEEQRRIVINDGDIAQLRASWYRQWQRSPTPEELRGLIQSHVRQEVLYREALVRGLDKNDQAVRNAMVSKMEFLGETQAETQAPTEAEIEAYFALSKERYRQPGTATFVQIYFNQDKPGARTATMIRQTLEQLKNTHPDSVDLTQYGDPIMLESFFRDYSEQQIANALGTGFSEQLLQLEPGKWQGPVASGYGLHLVYILEKQAAAIPGWQAVRSAVEADLQREAAMAAKELFFTEMLRNYQIIYRGEVVNLLGDEADNQ